MLPSIMGRPMVDILKVLKWGTRRKRRRKMGWVEEWREEAKREGGGKGREGREKNKVNFWVMGSDIFKRFV